MLSIKDTSDKSDDVAMSPQKTASVLNLIKMNPFGSIFLKHKTTFIFLSALCRRRTMVFHLLKNIFTQTLKDTENNEKIL